MKYRKFIKMINIILIAVFAIAAFNIGKIYYDYNKADSTYNELQNEYIEPKKMQPTIATITNGESQQTKEIEPPLTIDFDSLLNRNQDVVGWIYCPDSIINYPVVQGKNNDQYLKKDLDGNYLASGTIFVDYRNGPLGEDASYIIYGHNMKNGTIFGMLNNYKQQSYYDQHPIMYYLTPDGNYKLELFAGLIVNHNDRIYLPNQNKADFAELINEYRTKSTFKSDIELEYNDIIVTLSTCSYEFDNARYIVMGRLLSI